MAGESNSINNTLSRTVNRFVRRAIGFPTSLSHEFANEASSNRAVKLYARISSRKASPTDCVEPRLLFSIAAKVTN